MYTPSPLLALSVFLCGPQQSSHDLHRPSHPAAERPSARPPCPQAASAAATQLQRRRGTVLLLARYQSQQPPSISQTPSSLIFCLQASDVSRSRGASLMARPGNSLVAAIRSQHADPQQLSAPCRLTLNNSTGSPEVLLMMPLRGRADFSLSLSSLTSLQR